MTQSYKDYGDSTNKSGCHACLGATVKRTVCNITWFVRLGLEQPDCEHLKDVAVACTIYHTLKLGHRNAVDHVLQSRDFVPLARLGKDVAANASNSLKPLLPY